ncbi:hypothetical protein MWU59_06980 [Flavobacteriaceae bacterium F08102]|nr:hypothetical protein [Flavobacteriaceae bacterium F08102]
MIDGIVLIIVSILAVPSLLLSRKPDAKELLEKIEPYQGWIGVVACIWGITGVIKELFHMNGNSYWIVSISAMAILAILGFMLGYGLINQMVLSKSDEAREKAVEIRAKIAPNLGKLGVVGFIIGVLKIVMYIF